MPGRKLLVWFGVVLGVLFLCSYLVWAGVSDNATSTASVVPEKIRKEFIEAVKKDDVEKVRKLIESGKIGLNQALDDVKNVPLHYSAYYGALKVTQFLVEKGADVNIKDVGGVTPLSMAAYGNHTAVARFLVKNGADVNIRDEDGGTPLLNAAYNNNFELVKFLVEHGADVNIKTVDGQTPLINAAGLGNFEMVKFLVEHGADVNVQNKDGITPLINAVFAGNVEVVKFLLRHGAKIKPEMKKTLLIESVQRGNKDMIKFVMLGLGIKDVCAVYEYTKKKFGKDWYYCKTPISEALKGKDKSLDLVKTLIRYGEVEDEPLYKCLCLNSSDTFLNDITFLWYDMRRSKDEKARKSMEKSLKKHVRLWFTF